MYSLFNIYFLYFSFYLILCCSFSFLSFFLFSLSFWINYKKHLFIDKRKLFSLCYPKITSLSVTGEEAISQCSFCTHDEISSQLFVHCKFACSTWSFIQQRLISTRPQVLPKRYGHWLDGVPNKFSTLIRVERLSYYGHFGYVEVILF